ncbi:MAG: hypothetical protein JWQ90_5152 [Hydrocarboniphaga sp.]|uniref:toll/interleukin-1 receptor domain-containing protein n=1 Tax=Hydrocarboniphaga sp. TaxID=2033016 RepID=UPI002634549E|nr:TIR domain-containing protein [Hydrocarboniphaga sp.]MDB5972702.1 hypothetical protein [Hydrocarboniphaga sp.]
MSEQPYRYWAFISYSHHDARAAEQLRRWLERYSVPRRLVGRASPAGALPRRLFPIFRDRDELPSSAELGGVINRALLASRYLIVVCSPQAAASHWVNEEIRQFKAMGRADRVLALIVDGEPNAVDPAHECFPPALRWDDDAADSSTRTPIEPIAADARRSGDGESLARIKLVSGLLNVGLDELLRRERRRLLQLRLAWFFGLATAAALAASALVLQQREYAARERAATLSRLVENGRGELLAGAQMRAAVYLSEAYRQGVDTPALRFMLRQAMQPIDALTQVIDNGESVRAMALSRDDRSLVTLSSSGELRVWSQPSGRELAHLPVPDFASSQAFCGPLLSDDGSRLMFATVPSDGGAALLQVWSLPDGARLLQVPMANFNCTVTVPFSPDGSKLLAIAPNGRPTVWPLAGGAAWSAPGAEGSEATAVSFSADGRWLAAGYRDGSVLLWEPGNNRPVLRLTGLGQTVMGIDFQPAGDVLVANGVDGAMRGWTVPDGHIAFAGGHAQPIYQMQFAAAAKRLLTLGSDGERVWRTDNGSLVYASGSSNRFASSSLRADGEQLARVEWRQTVVSDVISSKPLFTFNVDATVALFTGSGAQLMSADPDGHIAIWSERFRPVASAWHGPRVGQPPTWWSPLVAFAQLSDGRVLSGGPDGRLLLWNGRDLVPVGRLADQGAAISVVAATPDGQRAAAADVSGRIELWDLASGRSLQRFDLPGHFISKLLISPDGHYLFAADRSNHGYLWRTDDGRRLADYAMDSRFAADFSEDSTHLAIGVQHRVQTIALASLTTELSESLAASDPPVGCLKFAPASDALVAMADDESGAARWVSLRGSERRQLSIDGATGCFKAEFERSGERVLLQQGGSSVSIWEPRSNRLLKLGEHAGPIFDAHWSPDGRFVVTGALDGLADVADSYDGKLLQKLAVHAGQVSAAAFSLDGVTVYSAGDDGRLQAWEAGLETRPAVEIASKVACISPWRLDGTALITQSVDLRNCVGAEPAAARKP